MWKFRVEMLIKEDLCDVACDEKKKKRPETVDNQWLTCDCSTRALICSNVSDSQKFMYCMRKWQEAHR